MILKVRRVSKKDKIKKEFAKRAGMSFLEIEADTKHEIVTELVSQLTAIKESQNDNLDLKANNWGQTTVSPIGD